MDASILTRPIRVLVAIAAPQNLQTDYGLQPIDPLQEFNSLNEALDGLPVQLTRFPPARDTSATPNGDDVERTGEQGTAIVRARPEWGYRLRARLAVQAGPEATAVGFRGARSRRLVQV